MINLSKYINEKQHLKLSDFVPEQQTKENEKWIKKHNDTLDRNDKVNTEHPDDCMSIDRDKQDNYETIKDIMNDVDGYVRNYKDSQKILDALRKKGFLEEDNGSGGTLYDDKKGSRLVFWLSYSKMEYLLRMLIYFHKYLKKFDYKDNTPGWRLCFDIHDDPMTGADSNPPTTTWYLDFKTNSDKLKAVDDAVEDLYNEIMKADVYWEKGGKKLTESKIEIDYAENYFKMLNETIE